MTVKYTCIPAKTKMLEEEINSPGGLLEQEDCRVSGRGGRARGAAPYFEHNIDGKACRSYQERGG